MLRPSSHSRSGHGLRFLSRLTFAGLLGACSQAGAPTSEAIAESTESAAESESQASGSAASAEAADPIAAEAGDGVAPSQGANEATSVETSQEAPPVQAVPTPRFVPCGSPPDGMACVPGGEFWIGADDDAHDCDQPEALRDEHPGTAPRHVVSLDTFYIDITEVTYEAYQACAQAGDCEAARPLYRDYNAPTQPMTGMNWFQAQAYCEARGGRLPTEAEFEAASGGPDGELTPFGNEPVSCENAIIMDENGRACGVPKRGQHPETGRIFEVASRPAGRYGLHDMVGNAEEWVLDWWAPDYASCGDACAGENPRGPCDAAEECEGYRRRVVRGGSWYWPASHATSRHRRRYEPDNDPPHHFGFRCVVPVAEWRPQ